jgi:Lhr-like helicase
MDDTIKIEVEGNESLAIKCATCSNGIPLFRGRQFPICDECIKDLREIIKERRLEKEKAEFKLKLKERGVELERRYFR